MAVVTLPGFPERVRVGVAWAFAFLLLATGGGMGYLSYEVAERLVHPPRDTTPWTPADRGFSYETVSVETRDGITLVGWWIPAAGASKGTVVFLHGYSASKAQALSVLPFLHEAGYHVLAFDFRAHGQSGGTYTTVGLEEAEDVRAAVAWLQADPSREAGPIALFGWSMGAAAALNAAPALPQVRALVVDSAFARLQNVVSHTLPAYTGLPQVPFGELGLLIASWMVKRGVGENEPAHAARALERPVLVIQGMADAIAGADAGEAIAEASSPWSELWLVPGAGHVNARRVDPGEYEARVIHFLGEHLPPVPAPGQSQQAQAA